MLVRVVVSLVCGSSHSIPSPSFNTCLSRFTTWRTRGAHVTEARFEKLIDICGVASVCSVWVCMLSLPGGSQHIPSQGFLVNNALPHVRSGRPSLVKSCAHTNSDWRWRAHSCSLENELHDETLFVLTTLATPLTNSRRGQAWRAG